MLPLLSGREREVGVDERKAITPASDGPCGVTTPTIEAVGAIDASRAELSVAID
jgi:hypothetical protein